MWTLLFILGLGAGVFGLEDDAISGDNAVECYDGLLLNCPFQASFPETKEELREVCPNVISYLECTDVYERTCRTSSHERNLITSRAISTAEEVCREGSPLHAAIGNNMKCIKKSFKGSRSTCSAQVQKLRKLFNKFQGLENGNENEEIMYENNLKSICLRDYSSTACLLEIIAKNCGSVAKEAVLNIFGQIRFFEESCQPNHVAELLLQVPQLDISEEEKSNLLEVLKLK